ncbi:TPA: DNA-binding domain-containing protein, partial [Pasteurella multocida]
MSELKTHFSAQELVDFKLVTLPKTKKAILTQAKREQWESRERKGKGGGYEYAFSSLPQDVQTEYLLKHSGIKNQSAEAKERQSLLTESAWNVLASATFEQEKRAERRFQAVVKVARLVENKIPLMKAFEQVVALYATDSDDETISKGSLKRWWYKVKTHPQGIWLPLLLDRTERDNSCRWADISDKAWAFFCADYLRKSKPKFSVCYYRLTLAAEENGWTIPSLSSLKRKFYNEFTEAEIALARGGEHELRELTAPQIRTVMDLEAYEIVNGDGYQHN